MGPSTPLMSPGAPAFNVSPALSSVRGLQHSAIRVFILRRRSSRQTVAKTPPPQPTGRPNSNFRRVRPHAQPIASKNRHHASSRHPEQQQRQPYADASMMDSVQLAARLRKSGDPLAADRILAPYDPANHYSVVLLNEYLHVRDAIGRLHPTASGGLFQPFTHFDYLLEIARKSPAVPNSRTYFALLTALRTDDENHAPLAPALFKRAVNLYNMMKTNAIDPDPYTLSLLFHLASAAKNVETLITIRDREKHTINVVAGTALITAFAKCGEVTLAQEAFHMLVENGVQVNERTFASIISAFYRAGMHGKVVECMDIALKSPSVHLNKYVFSGALGSCARTGDAANARRYFTEMIKAGVNISQTVLDNILDAAVRGNDLALANQVLFDWMHTRRIVPDRDQVNKTIALCGRVGIKGGGGEQAVFKILSTMEGKLGVAPDLGTYNVAISALGRTKNLMSARYLLDKEIPAAGLRPNIFTYNALIHACGLVGQVHMSFELLDRMRIDVQSLPNQVTYNTLLDQCAKAREPALVERVLREMETTPGITVDSNCLNSLLQMYRSRADAASAVKLFRRALSSPGGVTMDTVLYNSMISIAFEHEYESDGIGLTGKLFVEHRADSSTYNALMRHAGFNRHDFERASWLLEDMKMRGIAPDDVTYATMIRVCALHSKVDVAFRILGELQDVGLGCKDSYAWTTLIDACGRAGQWERSVEVLNYMRSGGRGVGEESRGLVPSPTTESYNAAIYAAGMHTSGWSAALRVFRNMMDDERVTADSVTYSAMASAILKNYKMVNDWDVVEEVIAGMELSAEAIRREIVGGNHDPALRKARKKISVKAKRLDWLIQTRGAIPASSEESDAPVAFRDLNDPVVVDLHSVSATFGP